MPPSSPPPLPPPPPHSHSRLRVNSFGNYIFDGVCFIGAALCSAYRHSRLQHRQHIFLCFRGFGRKSFIEFMFFIYEFEYVVVFFAININLRFWVTHSAPNTVMRFRRFLSTVNSIFKFTIACCIYSIIPIGIVHIREIEPKT